MSNTDEEILAPQDGIIKKFFESLSQDVRVDDEIVSDLLMLKESGALSNRNAVTEILRSQVFVNEDNSS